ncbi:hypothetical protein RA307_04830 [Xanthobacteraceae bacterium Astr-EGSB]|uniref:hypothetical protein n=1 Tax=Astrobacterium formosum TaxID=3069710 RepID=UPI0027B4556C|nr:hypothetical protein [Xanthobacteraceae bacterium Astr-EGSB]
MARIRTIKPEFPQSETIGRLSRDARLLFVQLWTYVDDHGRCRAASRLLSGQLYPYDDDAPDLIDGWLSELDAEGVVRLYEVDGKRYLDIPSWSRHQRIDNAGKSAIPPHPGEPPRATAVDAGLHFDAGDQPQPAEDCGASPRTSANRREPPLDLGEDLGEEKESVRAVAAATRPAIDKWFEEFWAEYPKRGSAANPRKPAAEKFARLVKAGRDPATIVAAAKRFCAIERGAGRYGTDKVAQAITWLNQERFNDYGEPQPELMVAGFHALAESKQLEAWDDYGRRTRGKPYPRDRDGGWRFPAEWPPDYDGPRLDH